ncbi:hypothetical protein QJS83_16080 [Bdellovibrio sp. 22V]|uniref:hypothetical protein n=1 Tax=Bdellovibrio sp. 22V TaxID=3044166 RepID=UPI00254393FF|nr:hypothetical protein [Bdellovibrio sp. 22V]WII71982.1 hypothetical protein QJS83_16080 [Bdellovibrio sp. 22V]
MRQSVSSCIGQTTLLLVLVISAVGSIFLMASADIFRRDYTVKTREFDQVLLNETTISAFAVMESALARRLWEPPSDNNCLKAENFEVSGSFVNGVNWKVTAVYNSKTRNFELEATGELKNLTALYKKRIKVLDVSDYLLFSGCSQPIYVNRVYDEKSPTAVIAGDRRVYTRGPLRLVGYLDRKDPRMNYNGFPSVWPGEFGTIFQADRMQFGGGIQHEVTDVPQPNPDPSSNIESLVQNFDHPWGTQPTYYAQRGAGNAIFTRNYQKALDLSNQIVAGTPGPLSQASVANEVYPIALFGGAPPLRAWTAADTGAYFNNSDRFSIFTYAYGQANVFGIRINASCYSQNAPNAKRCSNSEDFPRGFAQWRKDAGLEGFLFTSDSEEIPSPTMNWDNLEALEEDANKCGMVISSPINSYEDCAVWDSNFMVKYAQTSSNICNRTSVINLDTIALNNFNAADLQDPSKEERLLRRVIYLKVPSEIRQNSANGLMTGLLPSNVARKNLSLWVVSEDTLALRGYQKDTTSPLDSQPDKLREVVFNKDDSGSPPAAQKSPLSLVILSPEKVHLLSPFYVPMTYSHFSQYWPASGGKIRPINHNLTDAARQENDGFRYGYRRYLIENVSVISNSNNDASKPFYLRGLWSGPDSSASQFPSNQCMISLAGHTLTKNPTDPNARIGDYAMIPSYHSQSLSPIPPSSSRFYGGENFFAKVYYPAVFRKQQAATSANRQESEVYFTGLRLYTTFDNSTPSGRRDLSTPLHQGAESFANPNVPFDISHKVFGYDRGNYYQDKPQGTPCILENMAFMTAGLETYDKYAIIPRTNDGRYLFVQDMPAGNYRNLGSIVGVEQPLLEARTK